MIKITPASPEDLPAVTTIEQAGFSPAEAATMDEFRDRLLKIPDTFLVAKDDGKVVGFIVGPAVEEEFVTDEMYADVPRSLPRGGHQLVLSVAVAPDYRGHGVGSQLLTALTTVAKKDQRVTISLTSLDKNVPFYEKNGFKNVGVSLSSHAGETWYNLVKEV